MKKGILVIILVLCLFGCSSENDNIKIEEASIKTIKCSEIDNILNDGGYLIDVREPDEYVNDHLKKAINMPYRQIINNIDSYEDITKESKIIVYCQSGKRSSIAAQTLIDNGFVNVYDLGSIDNCKGVSND